MKKHRALSVVLRTFLCILAIAIFFWFDLPAINPRYPGFWAFILISIVICVLINAFSFVIGTISKAVSGGNEVSVSSAKRLFSAGLSMKIVAIATGVIILIMILGSVVGAKIFNASRYYNLISIPNSNFANDVEEISMSQIPIVDRDSASRLGNRKLGEMSDLVSQFEIMEYYTQINYKGTPYRVTPLTYADPIKWFNNQKNGVPAYITVNMVTQETDLVRLDKGIKYSTREYFFRKLDRHLRFKYPTLIFDDISFEIDDNGTPYWVAPTIGYKIGFWSGRDINGAVLVNAQTGECTHYSLKDIPSWVDQVFVSGLILEQLESYGKYKSGFFNSIFGQKGVLKPSDGYNYITIGDDVYLYTGMTSVLSDQSNVGFVMVNMRTKEAKYYTVSGAEENSAMRSAEGQVQHLKYSSTFPILLNVSGRPTYFISLKDDAGLVKMYAFVDVEQYQVVGTGNTVNEAKANYLDKLKQEAVDLSGNATASSEKELTGAISDISSAVIEGNTIYYIMLENNDLVFTAQVTIYDKLPFLKPGDKVKITYSENLGTGVITKIEAS